MAGARQSKFAGSSMYGTTNPAESSSTTPVETIPDRVQREMVLDTLLNSPYGLSAEDISNRANLSEETVNEHLNALAAVGIVTTEDNTYATSWERLPLDSVISTGDTPEIFLLEDLDKEYRQWFGVDTPYDATLPADTDVETAIAALDRWFGVRKRLHQLADTQ